MTTPTNSNCLHRHHGFTLVEMMIAIALGLLITSVVVGIFLSGNRNYAQDERYARLQENARFAMNTLVTDLGSTDFWGSMIDPSRITVAPASVTTPLAACNIAGLATTAFDGISDATAAAITVRFPCITDAKDNTSAIVIKRVLGACLANDPIFATKCAAGPPIATRAYLRTNSTAGQIVADNTESPIAGGFRFWEYIPRIYYIRRFSVTDGDGIPTLVRKALQGGVMESQPLVDGIENFRVTPGTAVLMAAAMVASPETPVPVKVYVLARSLDRDLAYNVNQVAVKIYNLGDTCFNTAGDNGCIALQAVDNTPQHYYRRVFSSTVAARNPGLIAGLN